MPLPRSAPPVTYGPDSQDGIEGDTKGVEGMGGRNKCGHDGEVLFGLSR